MKKAITIVSAILIVVFSHYSVFAQCNAVIGSSISPLEGCDGMTVQFNDLSSGIVQQRTWDFGDGQSTSGAQNPIHSFSSGIISDTTYIISLSITCLGGTTDVEYDTVTVFARPDVQFSADTNTVCAIADSICFINMADSGAGYAYQWSFGDFSTSSQFQPCHIFSTNGVYHIQLTVTSDKGCQNSLLKNNYISVINAPSPDFSLNTFTGCHPLTVDITNTTDTSIIAISNWLWNFGDGSPLTTLPDPGNHTFISADTFLLTLFATNTLGCSNSTTKAIVVKQTPTTDFTTSSPVCVTDTLLITYTGTGGTSASYNWNFSGGSPSSSLSMGPHNVLWNNSGTKNIILTVDLNGCLSSDTTAIMVNPNPVTYLFSSLLNDTVCAGSTAEFYAMPSSYNNYVFLVNSLPVQNSPDNVFMVSLQNNGDVVSVMATDINGCSDTESDTVSVKPSPVVTLTVSPLADTLCRYDTVLLSAFPAGYDNYVFYDDYLPVQNGALETLTYSNISNGSYLYVTAVEDGCSSSSDSLLFLISDPLASPGVNCGASTNNSVEFVWDAIEGSSGFEVSVNGGAFSNPDSGPSGLTHSVSGLNQGDSAIINIYAIAPGPCGNSDTVQHTCYALPCTAVSFEKSQDTVICITDSAALFISDISASSFSAAWANGSPSLNTSFTFMPVFAGDSIIPVSLVDSLQPGCPPTTKYIAVNVTPLSTIVLNTSVNNDSVCEGEAVTFTASPAGYGYYDFYNGYQLLQSGPGHVLSTTTLQSGDSITVIAHNEGCVAPASSSASTVVISPLSAPHVNCGTTTNNSIEFIWDPVTGSSGYEVSVNGGSFIIPGSGYNGLSHIITGLSPGNSVTLSIQAVGDLPCGNSEISLPVTCYAISCNAVTFDKSADTTICSGDTVILSVSNISANNYSIEWGGGAATTSISQELLSLSDTIISVTVMDSSQLSCPAPTKYIAIEVNPIPTVSLSGSLSSDSLCSDEEILFSATPSGYDSYIFYSGYAIVQSGANHEYATNNWSDGDSLEVTASDKGCVSQQSNEIKYTVIEPLTAPQVNCGTSTNNSIEFIWDSVMGSIGYQVSINGGSYIAPSSGINGLEHDITGLTAGDSITINVIATGTIPCGNSLESFSTTCYAISCNAVTFDKSADTTICSGDTVILSVSNISAGNYSIEWGGGAATSSISQELLPLSDTTISVTVIDSTQPGCPAPTKYIVIEVNPIPTVSLSSSLTSDSLCSDEEILFSASPSGYDSYIFYSGYAIVQSGANHEYTANNWSDGDSLEVIASDKGCTSQQSNEIKYTVIEPLTAPQVNCGTTTNNSIEFIWDSIAGSTGYQVSINGGNYLAPSSGINGLEHDITGLTAGDSITINVMATGTIPCGNSPASVSTTCYAISCNAVTFDKSADTTICSGDTLTLSVSNISAGNYSIEWGGGAATSSISQEILLLGDTIISVTVIDSTQLSCPTPTKYIAVEVNPIPTVSLASSLSTDSICSDEEILFSASPSGYDSYIFYSGYAIVQSGANHEYATNNWSDGDSLEVTASDKGCVSQQSNEIKYTVIEPLTAPQVNCGTSTNNSIEFIWDSVMGSTGYQVSINGGNYLAPSSGINGLEHDITGLTAGDSITINVMATGTIPCGNSPASVSTTCYAISCNAVTFDKSADTTICSGDTVTLSVSNISAGNYSIEWGGGAATTSISQELLPLSDTTISVTVIDSTQPGCPMPTKYIAIEVNPIPTVFLASSLSTDSICEGGEVMFTASPAGYSNYSFFDGTAFLQSSSYHIFNSSSLAPGNNISVVAYDAGCSDTSNTIQINIVPSPAVSLTSSAINDSICIGDTVVFTAIPAGFINYQFYNGQLLLQDSSINSYTALSLSVSDSIYTVASNFFGCVGSPGQYLITTVSNPPVVNLASSDTDNVICAEDTITLTASGINVANYIFYNNGALIQSSQGNMYLTNSLLSNSAVMVIGTGLGGCPNDTSNIVSIVVNPNPQPVIFSEDSILCSGSSVKLIAADMMGSSTAFLWNTGQSNDTIIVSPTVVSPYSVVATLNGCSGYSDTVLIAVDNLVPDAEAGEDIILCKGKSAQINASGGKRYAWSPALFIDDPNISNPLVTPEDTIVYTVTVYNDACFSSDSVKIFIDRCLIELISPIPQVISPNGDGLNDVWFVPDIDYFPDNSVIIYNRWGNVVFNAKPYMNTWNGISDNGGKLPDGTYYFILDLGNGSKQNTGFIMIHR